jgi:hypothetical protein
MRKVAIGCAALLVVFLIVLAIVWGNYVTVYNTLNTKYQAVNGAKSQYSAALNTVTQKIQGVWEIANQYLAHESKTFENVARARSGFDTAAKDFKSADQSGASSKELTRAGTEVVNSALAFRVQIEAYPQLRGVETSQQNIENMESSVNEIKTSLDDWIVTIKDYNTYRNSFWPSFFGGFMHKFPDHIDYYEGAVKELDINKLNPEKNK